MDETSGGSSLTPDALETPPAVRFASAVQENEISPAASRKSSTAAEDDTTLTDDTIDDLKRSLHDVQISERRPNLGFEPVSLPTSRIPSREDSQGSSRVSTPPISLSQTPQTSTIHVSSATTAMASPPLTPAATDSASREKRLALRGEDGSNTAVSTNNDNSTAFSNKPDNSLVKDHVMHDSSLITPQASKSHERPISPRPSMPARPVSDHGFGRTSSAEGRDQRGARFHRKGLFSARAGSVPVSRESSPSRLSASHLYSKPFTPAGEPNDPYAAHRRLPPLNNPSRESVDPRFQFSNRAISPSSLLQRRSMIFSNCKNLQKEDQGANNNRVASMSDLKRFFKRNKKRDMSPASQAGTKTPPAGGAAVARSIGGILFEQGALTAKYGRFGKVLGSGAGGSVRLMKRRDNGTVFAVKEFRARHSYETEKQYGKKVTAEFCVGSTLHHGNIIETLDIVQEKGRWYQVMEYAPFDLFAIVMSGRMKREEVTCCFLQILNGVTYLHSMGLAHRDLKLDNVVVSKDGIMKIIDFGSSHVFRYPFENTIVLAKGVVGSDPYLAPEVYDARTYDAQAADIWSLAIIYCCMSLRRFPWKLPRLTDNSFKLFAAEPSPGHDPERHIAAINGGIGAEHQHHHHHHQHHHSQTPEPTTPTTPVKVVEGSQDVKVTDAAPATPAAVPGQLSSSSAAPIVTSPTVTTASDDTKKEVIRGPWRILRLLPRESRHIIFRMLNISPTSRATMHEILQELWVADTVICQQSSDGEVIHADDHVHTLEPPALQTSSS